MKAPRLSFVLIAVATFGFAAPAFAQRFDPANPNSPMATPNGMYPMPTRIGPGATAPQRMMRPTQSSGWNNAAPQGYGYGYGYGVPYGYAPGYGPVYYPGNTVISLPQGSDTNIVFGAPDVNTGLSQYPSPWPYLGLNGWMEIVPGSITVLPTAPQYDYVGDYEACPQPAADPTAAQPPVYNVYNQYTTNNYYTNPQGAQPGAPPAAESASPQADQPGVAAPVAPATAPAAGTASAAPAAPIAPPPAPAAANDDPARLAQAFSDIARSWLRSDIGLLKKYLSASVKVDVLSQGAYEYSIDPDKLAEATDSVYDTLATQSFDFQTLRSLQNGDITGYARHVYMVRDGSPTPTSRTMYVSYTLGKRSGAWVIVAVDSSQTPLAPALGAPAAASSPAANANGG